METTDIDGSDGVTSRTAVFQIEIDEENSTTQEQKMEGDSFLETLSPLISSMRLFGLYFTRKPDDDVASSTGRQGCKSWNPGRIYATIMLMVTCLNTLLHFAIFDGNETIGANLFAKLGIIARNVLNVVSQSAYYVASHTGSQDRVFRKGNLSTDYFSLKYSRRVKVVTVVCWTLVTSWVMYYSYLLFATRTFTDVTMLFVANTLRVSKPYVNIIKAVFVALELQHVAPWAFAQAMNYIKQLFFPLLEYNIVYSHAFAIWLTELS